MPEQWRCRPCRLARNERPLCNSTIVAGHGGQSRCGCSTGAAATSIPTAELRALNANLAANPGAATQPTEGSFAGMLKQMVQDVNAKQQVAGQALQDLQNGQSVSLHQAMIAVEEANVSFQLMVEVRNQASWSHTRN